MTQNLTVGAAGGNLHFTKAAFVAGTTTTMTTTVASMYSVKGVMYTKAAITNGATPTTDAVTGVAFNTLPIPTSAEPAGWACLLVYVLNAAGTVGFIQGPVISATELAAGNELLHFPAIPDTHTPIGYVSAIGSAAQVATWTFGTDNLSSVTGVTIAFVDLSSLPPNPVAA